ncbi:transposase [Streptomyces sp. NPDC056309]|uniref:transposase n=1 Tax=unclassified Streptomyces TaxID=2593676 RepID=UPI0035DB52C9
MGRASPLATAAAFANYTRVAPVEIASADCARHRLSRSGDRQLNQDAELPRTCLLPAKTLRREDTEGSQTPPCRSCVARHDRL